MTRAVHAGGKPDPATGAIAPPIHLSTTFEHGPAAETPLGYMYIRESNPTQTRLEEALAEIEGGEAAVVFGSGLAAGAAYLQALPAGSHVIFPDDIYYGFRTIAQEFLPRWGMESTALDMADLARVRAAVRPSTRAIWAETPSNPLMKIVDLAALAEIAHETGAQLIVDGTFATPALQRPLELGADAVLHATTKYLGGHSDVQGGAVIFRERKDSDAVVTSATSWAPSPRRSTRGSCCAGCARSRAGWSATAPTGSPSRAHSRRIPTWRPCTIRASSPIRDTGWRRGR
jgi:cystathionine gamma-synthase